jgi:multiple sugar transport system permease protein
MTTNTQSNNRRVLLRRFGFSLAILVLVIFALLETVPFVLTISNSFKCLPAVQQQPEAIIPALPWGVNCRQPSGASLPAEATTNGIFFNPSLEGYQKIFGFNFDRWLINSVIYTVSITVMRLLLDSMAGYALARLKFPGNRALFYIVIGTLMIPAIVLLIPRFIILRQLNLLNTYQGVILALSADAFGVFLMKQFFESIPPEIEEAAQVDGANPYVIFFRVILPMATPALIALTIFSFTGTWNNFLDVLIIVANKPDLYNLPLGMAMLRGQFGDTLEWNTFLAGAVMTTIPTAIIFFIFQRFFIEGISYSGLKG